MKYLHYFDDIDVLSYVRIIDNADNNCDDDDDGNGYGDNH